VSAISQKELVDAQKGGWGADAEASRKTVARLQAALTKEMLSGAEFALMSLDEFASEYWPGVLERASKDQA
jgi:hypothetical protein